MVHGGYSHVVDRYCMIIFLPPYGNRDIVIDMRTETFLYTAVIGQRII